MKKLKITVYDLFSEAEVKQIKKTEVRNCYISDLTLAEILDISKVLNQDPETIYKRLFNA